MKLTLRDFLWLTLLFASVAAWGVQHVQGTRQVGRRFLFRGRQIGQSKASLRRQTALQRYRTLTDQQLDDELAALPIGTPKWHDFEPCLTEMARRGLADRLQRHYDAVLASGKSHWHYFDLELLTALRRAQGQPDPLLVQASLAPPNGFGGGQSAPMVVATITNVDVGRQSVTFTHGGDYRGGRLERWRIELTDEQGRAVPDCSLQSYEDGGLSQPAQLKFSQTDRGPTELDLRKYLAPPRSGKYNLYVLYHNERSIAGDSDVSGLIVARSAPIPVVIERSDNLAFQGLRSGNQMLIAILVACGMMMVASLFGRRAPVDSEPPPSHGSWTIRHLSIPRRDRRWCLVLLLVATGLWLDYQWQTFASGLPRTAEIPWSIALDHERTR